MAEGKKALLLMPQNPHMSFKDKTVHKDTNPYHVDVYLDLDLSKQVDQIFYFWGHISIISPTTSIHSEKRQSRLS